MAGENIDGSTAHAEAPLSGERWSFAVRRCRVAMHDLLKKAVLTAMLLAASGVAAQADDAAQKFAVYGIGGKSCRQLVESARKDKSTASALVLWVQGYLSAVNHMTQGIFEVSPIIDFNSIVEIVYSQCERNPDQPVYSAVAGFINAVQKASLPRSSPVVEAKAAGKTAIIRAATLASVQTALAAQGRYDGKPDGTFGLKLEAALRAYQHAEKLPETGLPDAATIVRLLLGQPRAPAPAR